MSLLNKKILVSGCGFSWSGQKKKTWVNILRTVGANIVDVGGPAVSNQWILNRAFLNLEKNDTAIIQLTSIGKLDIEVNEERLKELVKNDPIRNFTVNNIWPSSTSQSHISKELYYRWLHSPSLETEDLYIKLMLLWSWCKTLDINLVVLQAYQIPWAVEHHKLEPLILNFNSPLYDQYKNSTHYQHHDYHNNNSVPCIEYHAELAEKIASLVAPELLEKVTKIKSLLNN